MPKIKNNLICGFCKHYDPDNCYCMASGRHEIYREDTCEYWESDIDYEAQKIDAAERENHRKEVEGE
jgi:hypothetical protein